MGGMSPARRGWSFRATNDEVTAAEWVRLAYGEEAASKVLGLSKELRESLYGDVLRWGPAGDQIVVFLHSVNDFLMPNQHSVLEALLNDLSETAGDKYGRVVGFLSFTLVDKPYSVYDGISVVMRFLDGQYQFTAEEAAEAVSDGDVVRSVERIFDWLGLPALGGVFVGVVTG